MTLVHWTGVRVGPRVSRVRSVRLEKKKYVCEKGVLFGTNKAILMHMQSREQECSQGMWWFREVERPLF